MSAFRTTEAGVCGAGCGEPVDEGDLVVWINDAMVHLECEDPEKAIAAAGEVREIPGFEGTVAALDKLTIRPGGDR